MRAVAALDLGPGGPGGSLLSRTRDVFLFALYAAGVRFGDVATMKRGNVVAGEGGALRLVYRMGKTGKRHAVPLIPQALAILGPYLVRADGAEKAPGALLFPLLEGYDLTTEERRVGAVSSQNTLANKHLGEIRRRVEAAGTAMPEKLTFHLSRHAFGDLARKAGWGVHTIKDALGHSHLSATEHYLAGFDGEALDGRMGELFRGEP